MTEIIPYDDTPQLIADYHLHLANLVELGEYSAATRQTYATGLVRFLRWCRENGVGEVSAEGRTLVGAGTVKDWIRAQRKAGSKPASINLRLQAVKAFYNWCIEQGLMTQNPAQGIKGARRKDSKRHKRDVLTDKEVLRVLRQPGSSPAGKRDRAILCLMAYTGARSVEIHRANLEDVTTEGGRLVIRVWGKGHEEADEIIVLANPQAEDALYDWLGVRGQQSGPLFTSLSNRSKGERLGLAAIRYLVKKRFGLAGVRGDRKTTHSLRHTAITNAIRRGAKPQQVQAMARHKSLETTMGYYHEQQRLEDPAEAFIDYEE
jgi:site-specific recombinase XerD